MDVTKTLDDEKSVGSTNLPKDAGNVLERCDDMDVTKHLMMTNLLVLPTCQRMLAVFYFWWTTMSPTKPFQSTTV